MATSLQERLKLKQYQVDTWTTREQLCLASAVVRSGDQNWVAVRRNIKMLTNETSRPPDWYSTKNCALQYAKLLECVDTPKRKRERGDGANETPGEIVTKMLSKQRVEELQGLESEERSMYNQLKWEVQQLEAGLLDHQLDAFWEQLVKERTEEEEEEQRHQQWLKDRDEKITAIQQALKVPTQPHKKKQKLHIGGAGGPAVNRRNSGLSETSSEIDSAVDSPDVTDVATDSLVSNKNQDEGSNQESESKPTPTSPLLSSLLNKSPITSGPGSSTSPLTTLGLGSRGMRGIGMSPVSEALQNLVSSAISGTDVVDKDKSSHVSSSSGSSTLSLLLDLPPSTPGGPLPRLSDLPGPTYERREQEKGVNLMKRLEKDAGSSSQTKGCKDGESSCDKTKSREIEKGTEKDAALMEMEVEVKGGGGGGEEVKEEVLVEAAKQGSTEEIVEEVNMLEIGKDEVQEMETEDGDGMKQQRQLAGGESGDVKMKKEEKSQSVGELDDGSLKSDSKNVSEKTSGEESSKTSESKWFMCETADKKKNEKEQESLKNFGETSFKSDEKELKEVNLSLCDPGKGRDCETPGEDCEKEEKKQSSKKENVIDFLEKPNDGEDSDQKSNSSEEDSTVKVQKKEDSEQDVNLIKMKREQEEIHENTESKDCLSEEEGSFTGNRKRKISGGDFIGSSSPFVSESAPNSPASTHYGDDSENERAYRSWKKPIMILWNEIAAHKYASIFLRPITDDMAPGYHSVVYRSMDLPKVKRNIESGVIRTTAEFQRDIMLMFLNATMYNTRDHNVYHMSQQMMMESVNTIEEFLNTQMLARAEETPQKSLRRETRESSAKRSDEDFKRKRDSLEDKNKKRRM